MRPTVTRLLIAALAGVVCCGMFAPAVSEAASAESRCVKKTCAKQKKACSKAFSQGFKTAKKACADKQCRDQEKAAFKAAKQRCSAGFETCKNCCGDDPASCAVAVLGDGRCNGTSVALEECDGTDDAACPGACQPDCTCPPPTTSTTTTALATTTTTLPAPICGDGEVTGDEQCDDDGDCCTECRFAASGTTCDNGIFCDGDDACDAIGQCQPEDVDPCPGTQCQTCSEGARSCFAESGAACDDGDPNTNSDACDGEGLCVGVSPLCGNGNLDAGEDCDPNAPTPEGCCFCRDTCECVAPNFLTFSTTDARARTCGRLDDDVAGTDPPEVNLACSLHIGGGVASTEGLTPAIRDTTTVYKIPDACSDLSLKTLVPTSAADTGSSRTCSAPGCFFGAPIAISGDLTLCIFTEVVQSASPGGTVDILTGESQTNLSIAAKLHLAQPCPTCVTGACVGGQNDGQACTVDDPETMTSNDCPLPVVPATRTLSLAFGALKTEAQGRAAADGLFCPDQLLRNNMNAGAFNRRTARYIEVFPVTPPPPGGVDLTDLRPHEGTLTAQFCLPSIGPALDPSAGTPGPGAAAFVGNAQLHEVWPPPMVSP